MNDSSFFCILTLQQGYLDIQDRYIPRYSLPTKTYPVLNGKNCLFMQMLQPGINQNGSAYAELGRKPPIASANKE